MRALTRIYGDHVFDHSQNFAGQIMGNASVASGVQLRLSGQICGDLHIATGATVSISGSVNGVVFNFGSLLLAGVVDEISDRSTGNTQILPGATVRTA